MSCEAVATVIFVDRYNRPQDQLLDSSVITMKVLPLEQRPPPQLPHRWPAFVSMDFCLGISSESGHILCGLL